MHTFPACTYSEQLLARIGVPCPEPGCGGDVIERHTRRGRVFYGCSNYPSCRFASWDRPLADPCPRCGGLQVALSGRQSGTLRCTGCGHRAQAEARGAPEPVDVGDAASAVREAGAAESVKVGA